MLSVASVALFGGGVWKLSQSKGSFFEGFADLAPLNEVFKVTKSTFALGTTVKITVYHDDIEAAETAIEEAFAELSLVESLMSIYRPDSQLSQLNTNRFLDAPHPYLVEVLQAGLALSKKTEGAFDVTVQPLWKLHDTCAKHGSKPDAIALRKATEKVDWRRVKLTPQRIEIDGAGTEVTLNGIAQGFAADVVANVFKQRGIASALIDTGEIGTVGKHAKKEAWSIGVKHPRNRGEFLTLAQLKGRCLATSGDYESHFGEENNFRDHHLINPQTGRSPTELSSVSIVAPTALEADALSTAIYVMGPLKGMELIHSKPNIDALFVNKDGSVTSTPGFPLVAT